MRVPPPEASENEARQQIGSALAQPGWAVQNRDEISLAARRGVAVREYPMEPAHRSARPPREMRATA